MNFAFKRNMHLPHNPSSSLHGLKGISLRQFMIAKYISPLDKKCISLKTFQIHAYALKLIYHRMKICCWINFEMHFKSNSDKLHEQAFPKYILQHICSKNMFFGNACLCNFISLFEMHFKVYTATNLNLMVNLFQGICDIMRGFEMF